MKNYRCLRNTLQSPTARRLNLEVGDKVLKLLRTESNNLLMQWIGLYTVKSRVGANNYRVKMGSKTKIYHVNMLKKYIARGPKVNVVPTGIKDGATCSQDDSPGY